MKKISKEKIKKKSKYVLKCENPFTKITLNTQFKNPDRTNKHTSSLTIQLPQLMLANDLLEYSQLVSEEHSKYLKFQYLKSFEMLLARTYYTSYDDVNNVASSLYKLYRLIKSDISNEYKKLLRVQEKRMLGNIKTFKKEFRLQQQQRSNDE